jgi:hypothetical protein
VDTGEVEVVDEFWRVVGRDRTERKGALEVEASGGMVYLYAVIVRFPPLFENWVDMRGEHFGVEGCVVKHADGERAFVRVRWRMGLTFAVEKL